MERKQAQITILQNLKTKVTECSKELGKENSKYMNVLEEVRSRKGLKKTERAELEQAVRNKYVKNIDKIKSKYKDVFQYIKHNKLNENDLSNVHQMIRQQIKSL